MALRVTPEGVSVRVVRTHAGNDDRVTIGRVMATADIVPGGLAVPAILCVRSWRGRVPTRPSAQWERCAADSLDQLRRAAARPAREAVPANANAVVFADEAELLACLARDASRSRLAEAWWWHCLGLRAATVSVVADAWLDSPEYVPAALDQLAASRDLVMFLSQLSAAAVQRLCGAVTHRFGLTSVLKVVERASAEVVSNDSVVDDAITPSPSRIVAAAPAIQSQREMAEVTSAWATAAPEADDRRLTREQRVLLAISLLLVRAPAIARSNTFAQGLREWYAATTAPHVSAATKVSHHCISGIETSVLEDHSPAEAEIHPVDKLRVAEPNVSWQATPLTTQRSTDMRVDDAVTVNYAWRTAQKAPEWLRETSIGPVGLDTSLGGVFFLINLALALEWYADFTRPATPGLPLPLWSFLHIVGKRLVGHRAAEDPLWPTLANLAGQPPDPRTPWARWLAWRMPFLRKELRRCLRLPVRTELGTIVCLQPARLTVTDTHLDVYLSLAKHPIAIRIAGLDRDPGWVPAAGHFISFHFSA